eukprot:GHUV01021383.1.p1 GENE.GHUV01021383.1~~GHUV01021383.1.p1  ORF type:complete len:246 (-),score=14.94 GHUV01021383.1:53-790(-)
MCATNKIVCRCSATGCTAQTVLSQKLGTLCMTAKLLSKMMRPFARSGTSLVQHFQASSVHLIWYGYHHLPHIMCMFSMGVMLLILPLAIHVVHYLQHRTYANLLLLIFFIWHPDPLILLYEWGHLDTISSHLLHKPKPPSWLVPCCCCPVLHYIPILQLVRCNCSGACAGRLHRRDVSVRECPLASTLPCQPPALCGLPSRKTRPDNIDYGRTLQTNVAGALSGCAKCGCFGDCTNGCIGHHCKR